MSSNVLRLDRMGSTPWGTFGRLRMPDGWSVATVEPRWLNNAKGESCIPAGDYQMAMRGSQMVARTSGNVFKVGWEINGVPGRDLIMIHPGNWQEDSNGCVLVGRDHQIVNGKPGISASRAAFADLMARLSKNEEWRIVVRWVIPE